MRQTGKQWIGCLTAVKAHKCFDKWFTVQEIADLRKYLEGIYICAAQRAISSISSCNNARAQWGKGQDDCTEEQQHHTEHFSVGLGFLFPPFCELIYIHFNLEQNSRTEQNLEAMRFLFSPLQKRMEVHRHSDPGLCSEQKWPHVTQQFLGNSVTPSFWLLCTKTRCIFTNISFSNSTGFNTLFPPAYSHLSPQPYLCQDSCW